MSNHPENIPSCPRSATVMWMNWIGVFCMLVCAWFLRGSDLSAYTFGHEHLEPVLATILACMCFAIPLIVLEFVLLSGRRDTEEGILWRRGSERANFGRVCTKLIGLYTTLAVIGLVYAVAPEYSAALFDPFWDVLEIAIPAIIMCAPAYFFWVDGRMTEPRDGYWHLGALMLSKSDEVDLARLKQHALGWLVKGFFLPLMFSYFHGNLNHMRQVNVEQLDFMGWYRLLYDILIFVDVGVIVVGYAMTMRIFDNHIRSTEGTWAGWIPTLICYQPFWGGVVGPQYFSYRSEIEWLNVLDGYPGLQVIWAGIILGLMAIYTWASVSFGLRFSNLTHRGIITNGPYRFTKHPAYVSKNLSWWFESLPFITPFVMGFRGQGWNGHWNDAVIRSLRLLGVNLIYYIRARTEERHLSKDPLYVQYALWIEQNGMLRWVRKYLSFARYARPKWWIEESEERKDGR